jgi:hypothetical protein
MDPTTEAMIANFGNQQLHAALKMGAALGLQPSIVLTSLIQLAAGQMVSVSPRATVTFLRAYADLIEAGPTAPPSAQKACRAAFDTAAAQFMQDLSARQNFPAPQGSA